MLIALAAFFIAFLGSALTLSERLEDAVAPERVEQAVLHGEALAGLSVRLDDEIAATSARLRDVHRRHDATAADYAEAMRPLDALRGEAVERLASEREALRELLTAEEWAEVFPPPLGHDD